MDEIKRKALELLAAEYKKAGIFGGVNTKYSEIDRAAVCAIYAAIRSAQVPEWRPIETAPRDQYVIVWPPTFTDVTSTAKWNDNRYAKNPRPYWSRVDALRMYDNRSKPPTHWRPIIAAPLAEGV